MVRQAVQNGLSRNHDVLASFADQELDGKRYRAFTQRGLYLAELVQEQPGARAEERRRWSAYVVKASRMTRGMKRHEETNPPI